MDAAQMPKLPQKNQPTAAVLAALLCLTLLLAPLPAWASNFQGLWVVVYGAFIGIPYGLTLLVLGIIGLVLVAKKQHRPTFGGFLLIGPSIATGLYIFFPVLALSRVAREFGAHLLFASPIIVLTIPVVIFGLVLRKKR